MEPHIEEIKGGEVIVYEDLKFKKLSFRPATFELLPVDSSISTEYALRVILSFLKKHHDIRYTAVKISKDYYGCFNTSILPASMSEGRSLCLTLRKDLSSIDHYITEQELYFAIKQYRILHGQ